MLYSKGKRIFYVLFCVSLWALIPVVAKLGQSELDNHQFLFWSSLTSFIVLTLIAAFYGNIREVTTYKISRWLNLIFLGLLGTYIYYLLLYFGYGRAVGLEVLVFQYTWPVLIVIFSIVLLHEKITTRKIMAVLLGFAGVIIVLTKCNFTSVNVENPFVISLVLIGATCFALFSVLSKKVNGDTYTVVAIYFLAATIASFISMMFFSSFAIPSVYDLPPILINGILVNGLSYVFWQIALKSTQASFLAPFVFITPVLSTLYLVLFFHESFLPVYGIGLFLIIVAGLINSFQKSF